MSIPSFSNSFQPWTLIGIWRDTPAPVVQTSRHQRLKGESSLPRAWPSQRGISLGPAQRGDLLVLSSLTLRGPASSWELSSKFRQGLRPQPRAGLTQSPGPLPGSDALRWPLCHSGLNAVPGALFPALEVSIVSVIVDAASYLCVFGSPQPPSGLDLHLHLYFLRDPHPA